MLVTTSTEFPGLTTLQRRRIRHRPTRITPLRPRGRVLYRSAGRRCRHWADQSTALLRLRPPLPRASAATKARSLPQHLGHALQAARLHRGAILAHRLSHRAGASPLASWSRSSVSQLWGLGDASRQRPPRTRYAPPQLRLWKRPRCLCSSLGACTTLRQSAAGSGFPMAARSGRRVLAMSA